MDINKVSKILEHQRLMSLGTQGTDFPDNSVVCFAYDENCNLYFGSYSDTLKCKNIAQNPIVAITAGTLQIHGTSDIIPYGTPAYYKGRKVYDQRFPKYKDIFELENNELYIVKPLVIWNYDSSKGEMHRDVIIFDEAYFKSVEVYVPHAYTHR